MKLLKKRETGSKSLSLVERARARQKTHEHVTRLRNKKTRIGFIVDATASRMSTWLEAQSIQARMFEALEDSANLKLRLAHYGGDELSIYPWCDDPRKIANIMADVQCIGGRTQIVESVTAFFQDDEIEPPSSIILIGDAFEERIFDAKRIADHCVKESVKIYSFFEGSNAKARQVFKMLAEETDGKFAQFGEALPLGELCEAVALLTHGGPDAVKKIKNEKVKRLLLTGPSD